MTKFLKIKKLVSRHTKGFQAINEHMLLQNCGGLPLFVVLLIKITSFYITYVSPCCILYINFS